jgi:hypothetical protein
MGREEIFWTIFNQATTLLDPHERKVVHEVLHLSDRYEIPFTDALDFAFEDFASMPPDLARSIQRAEEMGIWGKIDGFFELLVEEWRAKHALRLRESRTPTPHHKLPLFLNVSFCRRGSNLSSHLRLSKRFYLSLAPECDAFPILRWGRQNLALGSAPGAMPSMIAALKAKISEASASGKSKFNKKRRHLMMSILIRGLAS